MPVKTIWSSSEEKDLDMEFTAAEDAAMTAFVAKLAKSGRWFTPQEVNEFMPVEHQDDDLFDTTDVVRVFLPDGYGVEMHGWEDFCIVKL